jgi:hypothetical protein
MINLENTKKVTHDYNVNKLIISGRAGCECSVKPSKKNSDKQNIEPEYKQYNNNIIFEIY